MECVPYKVCAAVAGSGGPRPEYRRTWITSMIVRAKNTAGPSTPKFSRRAWYTSVAGKAGTVEREAT